MQFSIGVEYALHCLLYMVDILSGKAVAVKDLEAFQGVSETYLSKVYTKCPCLIKVVMLEAEDQMRQYLNNETLGWLHEQVNNKIPGEHGKATIEWFNNIKSR